MPAGLTPGVSAAHKASADSAKFIVRPPCPLEVRNLKKELLTVKMNKVSHYIFTLIDIMESESKKDDYIEKFTSPVAFIFHHDIYKSYIL